MYFPHKTYNFPYFLIIFYNFSWFSLYFPDFLYIFLRFLNKYKGVDWENIRKKKAPFVPRCENEYDTSNFQTKKQYEEKEFKEPFYSKDNKQHNIVILSW